MADFWSNVAYSCVALLILIAIMGVVYFVYNSIRTKKQQGYYKELHAELKPGIRVTFGGGIYGTLLRVGKETCDVRVKDGSVLEVSRYAIQSVEGKDSKGKASDED